MLIKLISGFSTSHFIRKDSCQPAPPHLLSVAGHPPVVARSLQTILAPRFTSVVQRGSGLVLDDVHLHSVTVMVVRSLILALVRLVPRAVPVL